MCNMKILLGPVLGLFLLSACAPAPTVATRPATQHAADNLNAVAWTQAAIEHDLIFIEVYRSAREQLLTALADPSWDALPEDARTGSLGGLAPAVILDIDETVLDNSPYQAALIRDEAAFSDESWAEWVKKASARALPGALEFTQFAAAHGITVFYISNRSDELKAATLANLRKLGFPVAGADAFLGLGRVVEDCKAKGSSKACRRKLVGRNYRVLMQFGDQIGDFIDIPTHSVSARRTVMAPYLDWVGERWFVLPNPTYGSWLPALFQDDWSLPADQRHRQIIEALRYE